MNDRVPIQKCVTVASYHKKYKALWNTRKEKEQINSKPLRLYKHVKFISFIYCTMIKDYKNMCSEKFYVANTSV